MRTVPNTSAQNNISSRRAAVLTDRIENADTEAERKRKSTSADLHTAMVLMREAGFTDKAAFYVLAHLALCKGKRAYKFTNERLLPFLRKHDPDLIEAAHSDEPHNKASKRAKSRIAEIVRPYSQAYEKAAAAAKVSFIEISKSEQEGEPSEVTDFLLLDYLDDVDTKAKTQPNYKNKSKDIRLDITRDYARLNLKAPKPSQKKELPAHMRYDRTKKQTLGLLRLAVQEGREAGHQDWMIISDIRQMFESLEKEIGDTPPENELVENERFSDDDPRDDPASGLIENVQDLDTLYSNSVSKSPASITEEHSGGGLHFEPTSEARQMIDAFASVGVNCFQVTCLDDGARKPVDYQGSITTTVLREQCSALLTLCETAELSLIVRPVTEEGTTIVQLDDLDLAKVEKVSEDAFFVIETSARNFQAHIAIKGECDDENIRRLKQSLETDKNASGAVRLAGSRNFKAKHAPHHPHIRLWKVTPGRTVTIEELQAKGLLQELPAPAPPRYAPSTHFYGIPPFPSYQRSLENVGMAKHHEGKDRSDADFNFCQIASDRYLQRGLVIDAESIARRLMLESEKARQEGYKYALHTAQRAADVVTNRKTSLM